MPRAPGIARCAACLACAWALLAVLALVARAAGGGADDAATRAALLRMIQAADSTAAALAPAESVDSAFAPELARALEKLGGLTRGDSAAQRHRRGYESLDVAQRRLAEILSHREFARARGKNLLERGLDSLASAIDRLLEKLFRPLGRVPATGDALAWLVLIATVAVLVRVLMLTLGPRPGAQEAGGDEARSPETSAEWLRRAHAAAARGAFREAVHHAYWAAAHRLAESGTLPFDPTRTHRETLRRVPSTTAARGPLERLVGRYERVWYGGGAADDATWAEARSGLEELGCRSGSSPANASS